MKNIFITFIVIVFVISTSNAQELGFSRIAINSSFGVSIYDSNLASGSGLMFSIGVQKSYGKQGRTRLNPNFIMGGFTSKNMIHTPDVFFRIMNLGLNTEFDLLRYKSFSFVISFGGFINYTRGLIGPYVYDNGNISNDSRYFKAFDIGGSTSLGFRINPMKNRLIYEIKLFNIQTDFNRFLFFYTRVGVSYKLKKAS
jgi:hypothetical protein